MKSHGEMILGCVRCRFLAGIDWKSCSSNTLWWDRHNQLARPVMGMSGRPDRKAKHPFFITTVRQSSFLSQQRLNVHDILQPLAIQELVDPIPNCESWGQLSESTWIFISTINSDDNHIISQNPLVGGPNCNLVNPNISIHTLKHTCKLPIN